MGFTNREDDKKPESSSARGTAEGKQPVGKKTIWSLETRKQERGSAQKMEKGKPKKSSIEPTPRLKHHVSFRKGSAQQRGCLRAYACTALIRKHGGEPLGGLEKEKLSLKRGKRWARKFCKKRGRSEKTILLIGDGS